MKLKVVLMTLLFCTLAFSSKRNDVSIGFISLLGFFVSGDDGGGGESNIAFYNMQFSRSISKNFSVFGELYISSDQPVFAESRHINGKLVVLEKKKETGLVKLLQAGFYYFPFTSNDGEGLFLKGGIAYGSTYFKTTGFEKSRNGICFLGGLGYKLYFAQSFAFSIGLQYNSTTLNIDNPEYSNINAVGGATEGAELPWLVPELSLGYRF